MSSDEAEDVDALPRNRRKSDQRRRGVIGAAIRATEKPEAISLARLSMIAAPILLTVVLSLVGAMYADFKTQQSDVAAQMRDFSGALQQVLINQAVGIAEREDQKRRITKVEEGVTRLWQHVIAPSKGN